MRITNRESCWLLTKVGRQFNYNVLHGPAVCLLLLGALGVCGCAGVTSAGNSNAPSPVAPSITTQPAGQTVTAGQTATFRVAATGTAPLSYQWNRSGAAIAGANSSSYTTPATTSSDSGAQFVVMVSNSAGSVTSNAATLTVNPTPAQLSATPSSASFPNVVIGTSNSQTVTLTNSGGSSITISQASVSGTGFSITGLAVPMTMAAGASSTFNVLFSPATAGSVTGSVSLVSNAPGSPLVISVSGTGVAATLSLGANPSSLSFGSVNLGSSSSQSTSLTNNGNSNVTISGVTAAGSGFSVSGVAAGTILAPNQSVTLNVVFAPTAAGSVPGSVSVASNAPGSPLVISVSGTGVAATLSLGANPSSLSFGNVNLGSSSSQSTSLTNNGNSNVTISGVTATGSGFSVSGVAAGTILAPNQSATLNIVFAPTAAGSVTGSVSVASNATNSPTTITLAGTGQQAASAGQWITGFFSAGNAVLPISDIPWSKYTHINHFAAAPGVDSSGNGNGTVELHYLTTTEISQIVSAAHAAGKKIIVTIKDNDSHLGAFGQSTASALLATFVSNIANFVNSNGYDGVDFDWEQQIDVAQYENLLSSMKASFGGSKLILTDMGNWNNMPTIAAASYANIDQINLMCYDMEKQTYSWHNDALFQNGDTTKMTCDWRVGAFTAAGVPKAKIGIGIPFYGYSWSGCSQPLVNGCTLGTYATYSAIVTNSTWYAGGANHAWDSTFSADYLSVSSSNMFITYNDTTSIQAIVNWQKAQGFGGFMTFTVDYEYLSGQTGDARYPLSTALCQEAFGSCP